MTVKELGNQPAMQPATQPGNQIHKAEAQNQAKDGESVIRELEKNKRLEMLKGKLDAAEDPIMDGEDKKGGLTSQFNQMVGYRKPQKESSSPEVTNKPQFNQLGGLKSNGGRDNAVLEGFDNITKSEPKEALKNLSERLGSADKADIKQQLRSEKMVRNESANHLGDRILNTAQNVKSEKVSLQEHSWSQSTAAPEESIANLDSKRAAPMSTMEAVPEAKKIYRLVNEHIERTYQMKGEQKAIYQLNNSVLPQTQLTIQMNSGQLNIVFNTANAYSRQLIESHQERLTKDLKRKYPMASVSLESASPIARALETEESKHA